MGDNMEHVIDTFFNGLKNLKNNMILFVPFTVFMGLVLVLSLILGGLLGVFIIDAGDLISSLSTVVVLLFLFMAVIILLSCYVMAGTIGMAKEAIATGMTSFKDMFGYGKKYMVRITGSTILLSIIQLVSIVFWLPFYFAYKNAGDAMSEIVNTLESDPNALFSIIMLENDPDALISIITSLFVPVMIGCLLTFIYLIITSIVFYFVSYAIVVDDMPVIASFKKSFALLKQYPGKVIIFIVLLYLLSSALLSIASSVFTFLSMFTLVNTSLFIFLYFVGLLFMIAVSIAVSVATIVWETRFYMSVTEKELYKID